MWSALFGSDEDTSGQQADQPEHDKLYGAGDEPDAMTMLLGRLTHLLERLGEAEYSKKKWEEQARKLERANQELKYQLDNSTDPQLRERIDDLVAMNEALKEVKVTLEKDLESKEGAVRQQVETIAQLEEKMASLVSESESLSINLELLKESTEQEIERLKHNSDKQAEELAHALIQCRELQAGRDIDAHKLHQLEQDHRASLEKVHHEYSVQIQNHQTHQQVELQLRQELVTYQELRKQAAEEAEAERLKVQEVVHQLKQLEDELHKKSAIESQAQWKEEAIKSLTHQVQSAQKELSRTMEMNLELTNQNAWFEEQIQQYQALQGELESANENARYYKSHFNALQAEKDTNQRMWEELLESERTLGQQRLLEIEELKTALNSAQSAGESSKAVVESIQVESENMRAQVGQLTSEIQSLDQQWTEKYDNAIAETTNAKYLLSCHEEQMKRLTLQNESYQEEIESLKYSIENSQQPTLSPEDQEIIDMHESLLEEREQLRTEVEMSRSEIEQLKHTLVITQENMSALVEENSATNEQLLALETEKDQLLDEHAIAYRHLEDAIHQKDITLDEFQTKLAMAENKLAEWEAKSADNISKIAQLEQTINDLQHQNSSLEASQDQWTQINEEKEQLENEIASIKSHFEETKQILLSEKENLTAKLTNQTEEIESLKQQIHNSEEFAQECEATALEWEEKFDQIYNELASVKHSMEQAQSEAADEKNVLLQELESLKRSSTIALENESKKVEESQFELLEYQEKAEILQSECDELRQTIQQLLSTKDETQNGKAQLEVEIQRLKDLLNHEQTQKTVEVMQLQARLEAALTESEHSRNVSVANEARAQQLEIALKAKKEESVQLRSENQHLLSTLENGKTVYEVLKGKHQQLLDEVQASTSTVDEKESQIKQLTVQINKQNEEHERERAELLKELASSKKMLENVHASSEMSSQNLEDHIRELQEQMHSNNNKFESETEELLEEIASLNGQLSELQVQNNVLSARAHRLARDLSQYVKLPADDMALVLNPNTPNLWELLANGMEQLKSDLEIASTYAANLDQMDTMDNLQDGNFSFGSSADNSQEIVFIDHQTNGASQEPVAWNQ
ncbi:unnamed protein product [Aphanomyces euteiches]|uniref:Uncharacterized protein n=1 Tax=Aphanomyces euteiches TaxID=100861 RepID=A0A6G0WLP4_9STRA|nr:hypothetical protein Ae201684_014020 [Aphanomyces euteiches]KAH9082987.1 hypothetical protein Ae201684P_013890 [Aphanomyces euteiches]